MKKIIFIMFVSLFFHILFSRVTQAQTSEELFLQCQALTLNPEKTESIVLNALCISYMSGVVDGYRIVTDLYPQAKFICLPTDGLENDKVEKIFKEWLLKNPKEKSTPARSGILLSLREKYPCK